MYVGNVHTRKITGLDYRVWLVMLCCWLLCIGLVGYKQVTHNTMVGRGCATSSIIVSANENVDAVVCEPNRIYVFQILTQKGAKVEWNFDDHTDIAFGGAVQHSFTSEDSYKVVATVNGQCKYEKVVTVKPTLLLEHPNEIVKIFSDSTKATVGNLLRFSGVANFPTTAFEWSVLGTSEVKYGEMVDFIFSTPGKYTVQLIANNNPKISDTKVIEIAALPQVPLTPINTGSGMPEMNGLPPLLPPGMGNGQHQTPASNSNAGGAGAGNALPPAVVLPAASKPVDISEVSLQEILQAVLNEQQDVKELYKYLVYGESTLVDEDGKAIKLPAFCREKRRRTIESVSFSRDDKNSIQRIKVKLRRRGIFGGIFG